MIFIAGNLSAILYEISLVQLFGQYHSIQMLNIAG